VQNTRVLVIMRHAKAEPYAATDLGEADAYAAGEWLAAQGIVADHALVSSAARARATWTALAEGAGYAVEAEFDQSLFEAGPETALDLVRLTGDEVETLVVVGHNPTMAHLAQMLDDGDGDAEATDAMVGGFPPCALAVFAVEGPWSELGISSARVTDFHVGSAAG